MTSCIPDNVKEKMNEGLSNAQEMMADWEFKNAIAQIELYKLRNRHYPNCLSELPDARNKLDSVQAAWERAVGNASDKQLKEWSKSIANICTHNSYHTGQIVYIKKKNGWWDESRGVK